MQILNKVIGQIERHPHGKSSQILAQAALSACSDAFPGPPLIRVSTALDRENFQRYCRLAWIAYEPDFSNPDQDRAMRILKPYLGVAET